MAASSPINPSRGTSTTAKLHLPSSTDPPSDSNPPTKKVWLVFGATGHIGRSIVKTALAHGDNVAAVGRTLENSMAEMQGWHERCLGLLCDVRVRETVASAITRSIAHFGRVDIIVNCTGYGVIGACEDQDSCDLRSQFETNFLGTLNILQLSLPYFREQSAKRKDDDTENAGRYLIFSSTSGALGVPGLGPYCATKYATEGLIESMLYEIDTFGIKATLVAPGHVRLDGPSRRTSSPTDDKSGAADDKSLVQSAACSEPTTRLKRFGHFFVKNASPPYAGPTAPAGHARRVLQWLQDKQPTSAAKSAELVWQLGHCRYPPLRLLLGSFAIESVRDRLRSIIEEIEDWKHLSFPGAEEEGGEGEERKGDDEREVEGEGEGEAEAVDDGEEQEDGMDVEAEAMEEDAEDEEEGRGD